MITHCNEDGVRNLKRVKKSAAAVTPDTVVPKYSACKDTIFILPPLCDDAGKVIYDAMLVDAEFPGAIAYKPAEVEGLVGLLTSDHTNNLNQFLETLTLRLENLAVFLEQGGLKNAEI